MDYKWWTDPAMWALIAYSVFTVAFILERAIVWLRVRRQQRELANRIQELLVHPNRDELKQACAGSDAPLADVVEHVLKHEVQESPETTLLLLDDSLDQAGSRMKKNLVYLAAIAGTAPFMGLLGTVLGIIETFTSIRAGGLSPAVISAGIARALWTTAIGLVIAIPSFVMFNYFQDKANELVRELRLQANRIFVALGDL